MYLINIYIYIYLIQFKRLDVFSEEDANNFIKEFTVFFLLYLNK